MNQRGSQLRRGRLASIAAVVLLLVAALAGVAMWQGSQPDDDAAIPAGTSGAGDGLDVGDGPVAVEIYLDFLCPVCGVWDEAARPMLDEYLADGSITLTYHPIAILDRASTTEYSTRAAGAAACAADVSGIDEFVAAMMANQPAEGGPGLSDDEIIEIGTGVGLADDQFGQCVRDGAYHDWAGIATDEAADRGVAGTPTVYVDGERIEQLSLQAVAAAIESAG